MLVVSSCTDSKFFEPENQLLLEDFRDATKFEQKTRALKEYERPAGEMYTGQQHVWVMQGVQLLRRRFGNESISLKIVSAGYGLIDEGTPIVPYDVTFHGKSRYWITARARELRIPAAIRKSVAEFQLILMLLGGEYLIAIDAPLNPSRAQRLIYFSTSTWEHRLLMPNANVVLAGRPEGSKYGAPNTSLKGKMFLLLARALAKQGDTLWFSLFADGPADVVSTALEEENGR
jgi:hypothetical protein